MFKNSLKHRSLKHTILLKFTYLHLGCFVCFYISLFIFGCAGSSLLPGLSLAAASEGYWLFFIAERGLLIALASLVVVHGL